MTWLDVSVVRLRELAAAPVTTRLEDEATAALRQAADEIERLRKEVAQARKSSGRAIHDLQAEIDRLKALLSQVANWHCDACAVHVVGQEAFK